MIIFKTCRTPPSSGHAEPARFPLYFEMYYPFGFTTSVSSPLSQLYSGWATTSTRSTSDVSLESRVHLDSQDAM